jgi:hypothetical protein
MGQLCPIKCKSFSTEYENIVLQWEFKLNSALATAENWYLKSHMVRVKNEGNLNCI